MVDNLGKILRERQNELRSALAPAPPRLDPSAIRRAAPAINQAMQQAQAPRRVAPMPKPQPAAISIANASRAKAMAPPPPQLSGMAALMQNNKAQISNLQAFRTPTTIGFSRQEQEPTDEPIILYQLPDGTDVAMPSSYTAPDGWSVQAEITEENAIARAQNSPIWFDNQSDEVKSQVQIPGETPTNLSTTPIWMADDQARQQEELNNQDQSAQVVADTYRQRLKDAIPVTMASDQQRQLEEMANQGLSNQAVANAARMKQVVNQGQNSIPIQTDIARQQEELATREATDPIISQEGLNRLRSVSMESDIARQLEEAANQQAAQEGTPVVIIDGQFYPAGTTDPGQYEYGGPGDHNLPAAPEGYIWVFAPTGNALNGPASLVPIDEPIPGGYIPVSMDGDPVSQPDIDPIIPDALEGVWDSVWNDTGGIVDAALEGAQQAGEWGLDKLGDVAEWLPLEEAWRALPQATRDAIELRVDVGWELVQRGGMKVLEATDYAADKLQTRMGDEFIDILTGDSWFDEDTPILGRFYDEVLGAFTLMDMYAEMVRGRSLQEIYNEEGGRGVFDEILNMTSDQLPGGSDGLLAVLYRLGGLVLFDPLSWLPVFGAAGKGLKGVGTAIRLGGNSNRARQILGRILEAMGDTTYYGSRVAEEASDLGLGLALEGGLRIAKRTGVLDPTRASRAAREVSEVEDIFTAAINRTERAAPTTATVTPGGAITPPPSTPPAPGGSTVTPPGGSTATPPASVVTPPATPAPGGAAITVDPDGGTATPGSPTPRTPDPDPILPPGRVVDDAVVFDDAPSVPVRWVPSPDPARGGRAIDRIYQRVGEARWAPVRAEMAETWNASEANLARQGRGIARTEMALESSAVARDTIESMTRHGIYDGSDWTYNVNSAAQNYYYRAVEEVVRMPWADTAGQRQFLSTVGNSGWVVDGPSGRIDLKGTNPFIRTRLLDDYPNPREIEKANNFVDLMEQHAYWNPQSFDNADFLKVWQRAVDLDTQLRANGIRTVIGDGIYRNAGRPLVDNPYSKAKGIEPSEGADDPIELGTRPPTEVGDSRTEGVRAESSPVSPAPERPSGAVENDRAPRPTRAPTAPVRDTWTERINDAQDSTALVSEDVVGDQLEQIYDVLDSEPQVLIFVDSEDFASVPVEWRREFPRYGARSQWYSATYKLADGSVGKTFYAPGDGRALTTALAEARAKGHVPAPPGWSMIDPAETMGQDISGVMVVPTDLSDVSRTGKVSTTGARAREGETRANNTLKEKMKLPQNVGDQSQWMGFPIEKVYQDAGTEGFIATTRGGEIGFVRVSVKRGKYESKKLWPVEPDRIRAGDEVRIEMQYAPDNRNGLTQAQMGQIIFNKDKDGIVPDAPTPETSDAATQPESVTTPDEQEAIPPTRGPGEGRTSVEEGEARSEPARTVGEDPSTERASLAPEQPAADSGESPRPTRAPSRGERTRRVIRRRDGSSVSAGRNTEGRIAEGDTDTALEAVGDTFLIDPDRLTFDESQFQSRTQTNQQWVDTLAADWNPDVADPISVVELTPGQYTVVSGHHRTLAAQQAKRNGGADRVRIKKIQADSVEEAIAKGVEDSVASNASGLVPSPIDDARAIRMLQDQGRTTKAGKVGQFSKQMVDRKLALLKLPNSIQDSIARNFNTIPRDALGNEIPTGIKDAMGMTERKGAALAKLIDSGMYDEAGMESFYINTLLDPEMRMTDAQFEAFIDVMTGERELIEQLRAKQNSLFDMTGISREGFDPITKMLREQARLEASAKTTRSALVRASNKTKQGVVKEALTGEAAEIAAGRADLQDAIRSAIREQNTEIRRYAKTTEGQLTVRTAQGEQFVMDMGDAARPEMRGAVDGGTVEADDLLGAAEKTPEELRAEQLAAGQTDMFGATPEVRRVVEHDTTVGQATNGGLVVPPAVAKGMADEIDAPTTTKKDPTGKLDMDVPTDTRLGDVDAPAAPQANVTPARGGRLPNQKVINQAGLINSRVNKDGSITITERLSVKGAKTEELFTIKPGDLPASASSRNLYIERKLEQDATNKGQAFDPGEIGFTHKAEAIETHLRDRIDSTWYRGGGDNAGFGYTYATLPGLPWLGRKISGAIASPGGPMPMARTNIVDVDTSMAYWRTARKPLSSDEFTRLTQYKFQNGDTLLDRIEGVYNDIRKDPKIWHDDALLLATKRTLAEYEEMLNTTIWGNQRLIEKGVNATKRGAAKVTPPIIKSMVKRVTDILGKLVKGLDASQQYFRERMLFGHLKGPSYVMTQMLGNATVLSIGGEWGALWRYANLTDAYRGARQTLNDSVAFKTKRAGMSELEQARAMFLKDPGISSSAKLQNALGSRRGKYELEVYQGFRGDIDDPLMVTKALTAVNRHLGGLGKLSGSKRYAQEGALWDGAMRDAYSVSATYRELREVIPDYRNQTINRLTNWGMTKADAIDAWDTFADSTPGYWDMDAVIDHFTPFIGEGRATSLGRDWQNAVRGIETRVDAGLRKKTFAGEETRADLVLKRMFIFHHFVSRQSWFLASQAAHHPFLINLYMNTMDELEKATEDWPEYMQMWVKFLGFGGISLFMNPVTLAASFISFADQGQTWMPDEVTQVGKWAMRAQEYIGINPLLGLALNYSGALGDIPAPDPFMIWREVRATELAINWARYFGVGSDRSPTTIGYEQWNLDLREELSDWNPWRDDPVEARNAQADLDRDIQILVIDEAKRQGMDVEDPAVQEAMFDPESDLYKKALKRYLLGETAVVAADYTLGTFRPRVVQTNEDGRPIYANFTKEEKDLANTTDPRAAVLKQQMDDYYEIGTEQQQGVSDVWTDVAFGRVNYPVTVNGRTYSEDEISAMSQEERIGLADALVAEYGFADELSEYRTERDEFLADPANKEFAQFDTWRTDIRDYEGGVTGYWEELITQNPNAREYYESVMSQDWSDRQKERSLTGSGAFMAIMGIQPNAFAPNPTVTSIYTGGVFDPANVANQNPQPQEMVNPNAEYEGEVAKTTEYLQELQEWDAAVAEKQAELGYGTAPFNTIPGGQRKDVEEALEEEGVYEPEPTWQQQQYLDWAEQQPAGADVSIDAYLRWNERNYQNKAGERFEELMQQPAPLGTDNSDVWNQILGLLQEHDRERYP